MNVSSFKSSKSGIIGISSVGEVLAEDFKPKRSLENIFEFNNIIKHVCFYLKKKTYSSNDPFLDLFLNVQRKQNKNNNIKVRRPDETV